MKKTKFTEEQIAFALRQAQTGTRTEEECRKFGVSQATFYNWKKQYAGLEVSELRRLKQLQSENTKPKKRVADLSLDKEMLQDAIEKKALKPARRRELAHHMASSYRCSARRAAQLIGLSRSYYCYTPPSA